MVDRVSPAWRGVLQAAEPALGHVSSWNQKQVLANMSVAAQQMDALPTNLSIAVQLGPSSVRSTLQRAQDSVRVLARTLEQQPIPRTDPVFARLRELERQLEPEGR